MIKKRYILRSILIAVGLIAVIAGVFVCEQYYRWHICNFRAKDGEEHSYNVYAGASIDSVLQLLREDYEISSETDLKLHMRFLILNHPEEGHYRFPALIGDRELIERLKYGYQTPVRITWNHFIRTREDLAGKVAVKPSGRRDVSCPLRTKQRDQPVSVYPQYLRSILEYHAGTTLQPHAARV